MRPEALQEARDWLARAERDLLIADRALSVAPPLSDQAAYHAQQAAEKSLKGFLAAYDHPIPRTHSLERLVQECRGIDPEFIRFMASARSLSPYVTQFRYPGGPLEPDVAEAQEAIRLAEEIFDHVRQRLLSIGSP